MMKKRHVTRLTGRLNYARLDLQPSSKLEDISDVDNEFFVDSGHCERDTPQDPEGYESPGRIVS